MNNALQLYKLVHNCNPLLKRAKMSLFINITRLHSLNLRQGKLSVQCARLSDGREAFVTLGPVSVFNAVENYGNVE